MSSILRRPGFSNLRPQSDWRKMVIGKAGGASFPESPALTNLVAWYRTSSIGGVDNGAVSDWDDESGHGNHLAQPTGSKQPIYKVGVLNGRDAVRFTASSDQVMFDDTPADLSVVGATCYIVGIARTWVNDARWLATNTGAQGIGLANAAFETGMATGHGANGLVHNTFEGGSRSPRIIKFGFNPNSVFIFVGGTGNSSVGNAEAFTQVHIALGAQSSADTTLNFDGDISEVLLYNGALSGADATTTENYLVGKFGLAYP